MAGVILDVSDATFEADVLARSHDVAVVVDFWAPWCGPCRTLGPLIEDAVAASGGQVVLAKINVDDNPQVAQAFRVQSIPMVVAFRDGKPVNGFLGAQPAAVVQEFVAGLVPTEEEMALQRLLEAGDEASLRTALELDPANERAILALAELLVHGDGADEALDLLAKLPESPESRRIAAMARAGDDLGGDDIEVRLQGLLDRVKGDDEARTEFLDLLELLGPDDPRTAQYRKQLTARLF